MAIRSRGLRLSCDLVRIAGREKRAGRDQASLLQFQRPGVEQRLVGAGHNSPCVPSRFGLLINRRFGDFRQCASPSLCRKRRLGPRRSSRPRLESAVPVAEPPAPALEFGLH